MNLPAVLLKEPYSLPVEVGQSPGGHDPETMRNGGEIVGAPWNADLRGSFFVGADYQGYGGPETEFVSLGSPTGWDPHTGRVDTEPFIRGYAGDLQIRSMASLRAGQTIMFPTSGQTEPGFDPVLIEIANDPGTDVGWQQWLQQSRRMLFNEPPDFSSQTEAIPAGGWP